MRREGHEGHKRLGPHLGHGELAVRHRLPRHQLPQQDAKAEHIAGLEPLACTGGDKAQGRKGGAESAPGPGGTGATWLRRASVSHYHGDAHNCMLSGSTPRYTASGWLACRGAQLTLNYFGGHVGDGRPVVGLQGGFPPHHLAQPKVRHLRTRGRHQHILRLELATGRDMRTFASCVRMLLG